MSKTRGRKKPSVFLLLVPAYAGLAVLFGLLIKQGNLQLLEPAGYIANIQSHIFWVALILAGIIGTSIILSFFYVISRYSEHKHRDYRPHWNASKKAVALAWGVPILAMAVLSVFVWDTAHMVDPYKTISGNADPMTIQVVALQWKWLFIYPKEHIATINQLELPAGTPVSLELTADAPMNSFWIPRLSGQIYAMTGMVTQLHIRADKVGTYMGSPAEMSGAEFAGMDFTVNVVSRVDYQAWTGRAGKTEASNPLDYAGFLQLAKPSGYLRPAMYRVTDSHLFDRVVLQYMVPGTDPSRLSIKGGSSL